MNQHTSRKIALIDLDAYFCSAETLKDPSLRNIPFAVGGKSGRGVISTANYLAREYGVKSAMPSQKAFQLCPQLKIIAGDMPFYKQLSRQIYDILCEYSPLVEQASIDEFYIDLSNNNLHHGSASLTVKEMRERIATLGVTASAGISPLRMVAKIASEDNKPNGQTLITPEQVYDYLAQLPLKRIPGVGNVTYEKLVNAGFQNGADIQHCQLSELSTVIGNKHAQVLFDRCRGIDPRGINLDRTRKSIAAEITLEKNVSDLMAAKRVLQQQVLHKFDKRVANAIGDSSIKTQTVKVKFADLKITTVSQSSTDCNNQIFEQLLEKAWYRGNGKQVRLIGVSVALSPADLSADYQLDLF